MPSCSSRPRRMTAASAGKPCRRWRRSRRLEVLVPGASVLAVTSGPGGVRRALVAVQRFGEGRAMVFTGEAAWRWRMLLPAADRSYEHVLAAGRALALDPGAGARGADGAGRRRTRRQFTPADHGPEPRVRVRSGMRPWISRIATPDGKLEQLRAEPDRESAAPGRYIAHFTARSARRLSRHRRRSCGRRVSWSRCHVDARWRRGR